MSDRIAAKWIVAVMAFVQAAIVWSGFAVVANADEPQKPIRLPVIDNAEPAPVVPPQPKPVTVLPEDHFYVIESDTPTIIIQSPDGLVSVDEETGPIRLRGKFAGGSGKVESRTYSGKFVYVIEGLKSGQVELICIPSGVTSSEQIVRAVLSVNGAKPPPIPDDDKKDEPQPEPHSGKVHLDIIEDVDNRTADTAICLKKVVGWSELIDAGNSYLIRDKDSTAAKMMAADYAGNDLPVVIMRDKQSKKVLRVMPLPTFETLKTLVSEVGG